MKLYVSAILVRKNPVATLIFREFEMFYNFHSFEDVETNSPLPPAPSIS